MARLFPCDVPPWLLWFVAGLFVAATVSLLITRSVAIRAPARKTKLCLETWLPQVRSGDVVLLAGVSFMGRAQRFILNTPVSHVGVVIVEREGTDAAQPWVLEAGRDHGVALTPLWTWLQCKDSRVFYRQLHMPGADDHKRRTALDAFVSRQLGRPYSYRFWMEATRVLPFTLPMPFDPEGKDEARFCSELVAEALVSAGALNHSQPCHLVMPRNLLQEPAVAKAGDSDDDDGGDCENSKRTSDRGKLQWLGKCGLGPVQSLVTKLSVYEVGRRAAEARRQHAPHAS